MHFVLGTNTFGAGDNAFHAGDEHFSVGDERIEKSRSNFSQTHTQLAARNFQTELTCMLSSLSKMGIIPLWRSKRYLDAQQCLQWHLIGLQSQVNSEKYMYSWSFAYSQGKLVAACNPCIQLSGCGLTICATPRIREVKPQKLTTEHAKASLETVLWP